MIPTSSRLPSDKRASIEKARREGTRLVLVVPGPPWDRLELRTSDGGSAITRSGTVYMVNPPDRAYDYRARVEIDRSNPDRPRAFVSELAVVSRLGTRDLGAKRLQAEGVGWLLNRAVISLTTSADDLKRPLGITEGSARRLLARDKRRQKGQANDAELRIAVAAYDEAGRRGVAYRPWIAARLRDKGYPSSRAQVGKHLAVLRAQGRIPAAGPGRTPGRQRV